MTDQLTLAVDIIARSKKNVSKKDGLQKKLVLKAVLQFIWKTFFDPRLQNTSEYLSVDAGVNATKR